MHSFSAVARTVALATLLVAASMSSAEADMGEVSVYNWQQNDTPVVVVPGRFCTINGKHKPVTVAIGKGLSLDCDAVLEQDASPVTLFFLERANDQTSLCSVRWDNDGIFAVEAGLVCRYGETSAADITVFTR